jgi:hypothetical protein
MYLSEIDFGPEDAAMDDDPEFLRKFIDPDEIQSLLSDKYWIISGEKGSGKTALRRAYSVPGTQYHNKFSSFIQITYDDLELKSFKPLLEQLGDRSKVAKLTLLANCWEYIILNEVIEAARAQGFSFSDASPIDQEITAFRAGIHGPNLNKKQGLSETIGSILERMFELLVLKEEAAEPAVSIRTFPAKEPEFAAMIEKLSQFLQTSDKRILVLLDGFDHLIADYKERRHVQRVFEGLVTAVYSLALRKQLQGRFFIKALIPYDRFVSLNLRDMDKIQSLHRGIRWDRKLLKKFIERRLQIQLPDKQTRNQNFDQIWNSLLPDRVLNVFYQIIEQSFDYILRHTMWRPRHLQIQLKTLAEMFPNQEIDAGMLRDSVRAACYNLVIFFVQEYEIDHPYLDAFLNMLRGQKNIMTYGELYSVVDAVARQGDSISSIEETIISLYKIGFFGVYENISPRHDSHRTGYVPPRKSSVQPYCFKFYYNSPTHEGLSFSKETKVGIHPIFFDRCRLVQDPDMIVG